jgi:hypothetical protein
MIDYPQYSPDKERSLVNDVSKQFGSSLCHKSNLILGEKQPDKQGAMALILLPAPVWINELANPQRQQIMHPQLQRLADSF